MTTDRKIDMAEPEALAPCPFCGGSPEQAQEWGRKAKAKLIHCADPQCLGHHCEQDEQGGYNHEFDSLSEAIAAWNRRSPVAISEEMVERAARAMHDVMWGAAGDGKEGAWLGMRATLIRHAEAALTAALVSPAVTAPRVRKLERQPLVWDGDTEPDGFDARQNLADIIANPSTPTADELVQAQAALARMDAREAAVPIASAELVACGLAKPSYNDCPNMKEVGGGFEGERYRCAVCGKGYFLDYEDMK